MITIAIALLGIAVLIGWKDLFVYLRKNHQANKQSREILDMIKQKAPSGPEPTFNHDIQPDFSGYFN